ncbi:PEP-CTERM sorting domain-containing protein [Congregibacter variabilis]
MQVIRITEVPAPPILALLGLGILGLAWKCRK